MFEDNVKIQSCPMCGCDITVTDKIQQGFGYEELNGRFTIAIETTYHHTGTLTVSCEIFLSEWHAEMKKAQQAALTSISERIKNGFQQETEVRKAGTDDSENRALTGRISEATTRALRGPGKFGGLGPFIDAVKAGDIGAPHIPVTFGDKQVFDKPYEWEGFSFIEEKPRRFNYNIIEPRFPFVENRPSLEYIDPDVHRETPGFQGQSPET